jgi:hypothetical protein
MSHYGRFQSHVPKQIERPRPNATRPPSFGWFGPIVDVPHFGIPIERGFAIPILSPVLLLPAAQTGVVLVAGRYWGA